MRSTHIYWMLCVFFLGLTVWASIPQDVVALNRDCEPATMRAKVSRVFHGGTFWQAQLAAAIFERDRLLYRINHPDEENTIDEPAYETRMMRLSDEDRNSSPDVKAQHEEGTRKRRVERMLWLTACQQSIEQRLAK